jgi:hypothetical protein
MQYYQSWQQYYYNQCQWAQWSQSQEAAQKKAAEDDCLKEFDVEAANQNTLRVNQQFDDAMHESQWFSELLNFPITPS